MKNEFERKVDEFLRCFELVFGEDDWQHTRLVLENPEGLIDTCGTFINPDVDDESDNWANRGGLLQAYRELKKYMTARRIPSESQQLLEEDF